MPIGGGTEHPLICIYPSQGGFRVPIAFGHRLRLDAGSVGGIISHEVKFTALGMGGICARASHHWLRRYATIRCPVRRGAVGMGLKARK